METVTNKKVKNIRTDQGTEYKGEGEKRVLWPRGGRPGDKRE